MATAPATCGFHREPVFVSGHDLWSCRPIRLYVGFSRCDARDLAHHSSAKAQENMREFRHEWNSCPDTTTQFPGFTTVIAFNILTQRAGRLSCGATKRSGPNSPPIAAPSIVSATSTPASPIPGSSSASENTA